MTATQQIDRKQWDAVMRREAAEKILDSGDPRQAFRETARRYKLQPYQLYAWVGQAAIARKQKQSETGPGERRVSEAKKPSSVGEQQQQLSAGEIETVAAIVRALRKG